MPLAPVAIFAYRRPAKLQALLASLASCPEAGETHLEIFVDGPKTPSEIGPVSRTREIALSENRFKSVETHFSPANQGLSKSVISGIDDCLARYDSVIVLEDDLIVSPYFLTFMNSGLRTYKDDAAVISIHGFMCNTKYNLPETFFIRGADCWGWATWRRGWSEFNSSGADLLRRLDASGEADLFDFHGSYPYRKMLEEQKNGLVDSWAIRWYASAFLSGRLTLHPGRSLVANTGLDGTGTHGIGSSRFLGQLTKSEIPINRIELVESRLGREAISECLTKATTSSHTRSTFLSRLVGQTRQITRGLK